ncbi:MAG TPA: DegT/DnrJ/EryC1/StrS family aminotransferase [bacterium]|nr:DegT/DnrJ/EryC1/StrS family aminotransferase [bacterium]
MTSPRTVPFFPYNRFFSSEETELTAVLQEVLRRGAFILQKDVVEFEKNIAEYIGAKHVIGVANATDALILALRAADIGPGQEVIFSSHTFVATASAIHFAGAIPVPVECGPDHMIDPKSVETAITSKTRAIMPTQLNGRTCDMDALLDIARRHNLQIVEDSAQGLGSQFKKKFAGTFGLAGVLSFYPAKILGCFGDGGAVITSDDEIARKIRLLRDHGRDELGNVVCWGLNSRLDNIQAAVLNYYFRHFPTIVSRRREIAKLYNDQLKDVKQLSLPPAPGADADHFDTYQNYEIEAERRDELKNHLKDRDIGTLIQWGGSPVHQFRELGFKTKLPFTENLFTRLLMLPMNPLLSNDDALYISETIRKFYRK